MRLTIWLLLFCRALLALPVGMEVAGGAASAINGASSLHVETHGETFLDWQKFSIGRDEEVYFTQDGAVYNRVVGLERSEIFGKLFSDGVFYLFNPNGLLIGKEAHIKTAGFIASTNDLLINHGRVEASGDVFFLAREIENSGHVEADNVYLIAEGFRIRGESVDAGNPYAMAIRHSGKITARKTTTLDGAGITKVDGAIQAPKISVLGDVVHLERTGLLDASPGGEIYVGDNKTRYTWVDEGSLIKAQEGGRVIVWAEGITQFAGLIDARGKCLPAFAEVSGKGELRFLGKALLYSEDGKKGELLLDPTDITITAGADSNGAWDGMCPASWALIGTPATSNIDVSGLVAQLNTPCDVTISTAGGGASTGTIAVQTAVSWASSGNLTLIADATITATASISNSGSGGISMTAGGGVIVTNTITMTSGDIVISGTNTSTTANASGISILSTTLTTGGAISLTGTSTAVGGSGNRGVRIATGRLIAAGTISISGHSTGANNQGINLGPATITTTGSGDIVLIGSYATNTFGGTNIGVESSTGTSQISSANNILITGTSGGTSTSRGVRIQSNPTFLNASSSIQITGSVSGAGTGIGVDINNGPTVNASNSITLSGTSTASGSSSHGMSFVVLSMTGTVNLINCASGTGNTSNGVSVTGISTINGNAIFSTITSQGSTGGTAVTTSNELSTNDLTFLNCAASGSTSGNRAISIATLTTNGNLTFATISIDTSSAPSFPGTGIFFNGTVNVSGAVSFSNITATFSTGGGTLLTFATMNVSSTITGSGLFATSTAAANGISYTGPITAQEVSFSVVDVGTSGTGISITNVMSVTSSPTGRITLTATQTSGNGFSISGSGALRSAGGDITLTSAATGAGISISSVNPIQSATGNIMLSGTTTGSSNGVSSSAAWSTGTTGTLSFVNCRSFSGRGVSITGTLITGGELLFNSCFATASTTSIAVFLATTTASGNISFLNCTSTATGVQVNNLLSCGGTITFSTISVSQTTVAATGINLNTVIASNSLVASGVTATATTNATATAIAFSTMTLGGDLNCSNVAASVGTTGATLRAAIGVQLRGPVTANNVTLTTVSATGTSNATGILISGTISVTNNAAGTVALSSSVLSGTNSIGIQVSSPIISDNGNITLSSTVTTTAAGTGVLLAGLNPIQSTTGDIVVSAFVNGATSGYGIYASQSWTTGTTGTLSLTTESSSISLRALSTSGQVFLTPSPNVSGTFPLGIVFLNGDLTGSAITIDSGRASYPTVASIVAPSDVTITADSFSMGQRESFTSLGSIFINATTLTLGDLVALDEINFSSAVTVNLNTHGEIDIYNDLGDLYISGNLHFLAGTAYNPGGTFNPSGPVNTGTTPLTVPLLTYNGYTLNYDTPYTPPTPPPTPPPVPPSADTMAYNIYLLTVAGAQFSDYLPLLYPAAKRPCGFYPEEVPRPKPYRVILIGEARFSPKPAGN